MFNSHFSSKVIKALARKGICIIGLTVLPLGTGHLALAQGDTGYALDNNGEYQVRSYLEVVALAS